MAESDKSRLYLSSSPHFSSPVSTRHLMFSVMAALLPIAAYGIWIFGVPALVTVLVSVASAVVAEALFRFATGKDIRVGDFSAVITGLLLAMVLPPATPVWMTALGAFFAIIVAKEFFGGLGANVFNPALTGRAFLLVSFATPLTTWIAPRFASRAPGLADATSSASHLVDAVDAVSSATPLSYLKPVEGAVLTANQIAEKTGFSSKFDLYWNLFLGNRAGSLGESGIFLILIAFAVLVLTKVIDWRAPVAMMVTAVAVAWIAGVDPVLTLLSGGLVFGAVFMTTDYATSPVTPYGRLIFGAGCGLITALIRIFGGYPEGVMFSILIMNSVVPYLNRIIVRKYGWVPRAGKAAK